jgi:hypothetical protein
MSDLYRVYAVKGGQVRLISVLPDGNAATTHSSAGTAQTVPASFKGDAVRHAVAEDGSLVYWSASTKSDSPQKEAGNGNGDEIGALYARLNPIEPQSAISAGACTEPAKACTIEIAKANARFIDAAADGSIAIYKVGEELFEFELAKALASEPASTLIAKGVAGVMGAGEDATRLYFASKEDLGGGANSEGDVAQDGKPNLYLRELGAGVEFVATLGGPEIQLAGNSPPLPISRFPSLRTSRVSPDGLHAAFASSAPLTGFDNTDANSEQPDSEIFVYDASANSGAGELLCASCNPSGARPVGREVWSGANGAAQLWAAARLPGWIDQLHPGRLLSEDGGRLFFESFEALIPGDTNGQQDVYEWERAGKGSCKESSSDFFASNGGCLSLISSGESAKDSELIDASEGGTDVFFATQSSLLVEDYGLRDIYDARVGGGFPPPPVPPVDCEGEACQGTASNPDDPTPASSAYRGPGNPPPPPAAKKCPKGKHRVVRKGKARWVNKHTKHKQNGKSHNDRRAAR